MSAFRPSLPPRPSVFSSSSLATHYHHSVPTFPRPLFSCTYKSLRPPARFEGPLFSYTYKSIFPQPFPLHNDTKRPGVTHRSAPPRPRHPVFQCVLRQTPCFQQITDSLSLFALFFARLPF